MWCLCQTRVLWQKLRVEVTSLPGPYIQLHMVLFAEGALWAMRLSLLTTTFKLSFAQSSWRFNLTREFYIYHLLLLVSWGSCRPMSPSKLEAGPGSPSWDEKESRRLFTRFTSTSTGVSSSSSVWIVAFDVPWIQINLCQFKESS